MYDWPDSTSLSGQASTESWCDSSVHKCSVLFPISAAFACVDWLCGAAGHHLHAGGPTPGRPGFRGKVGK